MKKAKKEKRIVLAVFITCALMITPLFSFLSPAASMTVSAHGRHGSGHHAESSHSASPEYYYCHGHEAHLHEGGVCPYADCYDNGACPYADNYNGTVFSHGCFNHMNSGTTPRQHCCFLIPTAMGISFL